MAIDPISIGIYIGVATKIVALLKGKPLEFKLDAPDQKGENYKLIHNPTGTVIAEERPEIIKALYKGKAFLFGVAQWTKDAREIVIANNAYSTKLLFQKKNVDPMTFADFVEGVQGGIQTVKKISNEAQNTWGSVKGFYDSFSGSGGGGTAPKVVTDTPGTEWYKNPLVWIGGGVVILFLFGKKLMRVFR